MMLSCALLAAAWHFRTLATEVSARLRRGRHARPAREAVTRGRHRCTARASQCQALHGTCRSPVPRRPAREHLACLRHASRHGGPVPLRWNIDRAIQSRRREVDSNGEGGPAGRPLDRHPEHGPLPLRRTLVRHLLRVAAPPRPACRQRAKPFPTPPPANANGLGCCRGRQAFEVGVTGFEPAASCSRSKRSTKLSYTPLTHSRAAGREGYTKNRVRTSRLRTVANSVTPCGSKGSGHAR